MVFNGFKVTSKDGLGESFSDPLPRNLSVHQKGYLKGVYLVPCCSTYEPDLENEKRVLKSFWSIVRFLLSILERSAIQQKTVSKNYLNLLRYDPSKVCHCLEKVAALVHFNLPCLMMQNDFRPFFSHCGSYIFLTWQAS